MFSSSTGFVQAPVLAKGLVFEPDDTIKTPETGELWRENDQLFYRTSGSTICLSDKTDQKSSATSHYLNLAQDIKLDDNQKSPRTILPHLTVRPGIDSKWRLVRIDVACETVPSIASAKLDVIDSQGFSILASPIEVAPGDYQGFSLDFQKTIMYAGESLRLVVTQANQAQGWSGWILIEEC